jgi:hypothetical protein
MEIDKLIDNLESLHKRGVRTIKLVFCKETLQVKELLDEIKLRNNSQG